MKTGLCEGWQFTGRWSEDFAAGRGDYPVVRLPHTVRELPLHHADSEAYQMVCGYRRALELAPELADKRIFLQFDGAAHIATVYVNGVEAATHRTGYTAFRVELTGRVAFDRPNLIAVELDTTENPAIPPFGYVVDYLTYGGLYREVWLDVREKSFLSDVFVTTPDLHTARVRVAVDPPQEGQSLALAVLDGAGDIQWQGEIKTAQAGVFEATAQVPSARPWELDDPVLYTLRATLKGPDGGVLDSEEVTFGFRTAVFEADGFYLNGKKRFLRGLDRHQCWPYVGYAVPEALQRHDARILKEELGCNTVRTSHYPQSHHFLDECDRIGLLVFTEIPGWQHIGDEGWKDQAVENVREMILQYRNHPSIILWGVRINESLDDDAFYRRTNALAHELDPSRPTSGVRNFEQSHLLEDVYAFNDFSYWYQKTPSAVKAKKDVVPDGSKALLISEHSGHMDPTKPFDHWSQRARQAYRHARILNDAMADGGHVGCLGWCMFDYATHRDFGSGDRICYHGVTDSFRNPKPAAAVYASQADAAPVLEVMSGMDLGDYPAGNIGVVWVYTNTQRVALYKNGVFVTYLSPSELTALPHPPMLLDDMVGDLLESQEGFDHGKAQAIHACLRAAGKYGLGDMPLKYKLKMALTMAKYKMTMKDGVALYGKYIGNWGGTATTWRFDGEVDGKVVVSVTKGPSAKLRLDVRPSHTHLRERVTYDMASVRIRVLDGQGNVAPYAQLPVRLSLAGPARLVGPDVVTAEGGMCGTYLRTAGEAGKVKLTVSTDQTEPVELEFDVTVG